MDLSTYKDKLVRGKVNKANQEMEIPFSKFASRPFLAIQRDFYTPVPSLITVLVYRPVRAHDADQPLPEKDSCCGTWAIPDGLAWKFGVVEVLWVDRVVGWDGLGGWGGLCGLVDQGGFGGWGG